MLISSFRFNTPTLLIDIYAFYLIARYKRKIQLYMQTEENVVFFMIFFNLNM
jgi:hypothetical protein